MGTGFRPCPFSVMKETKWLYQTQAWRKVRNAYFESVGGLCEDCLEKGLIVPGAEVHHKIFLTPRNMYDPDVVFNPDNLVLLCKNCHAMRHKMEKRRYKVTENGRILALDCPQ